MLIETFFKILNLKNLRERKKERERAKKVCLVNTQNKNPELSRLRPFWVICLSSIYIYIAIECV